MRAIRILIAGTLLSLPAFANIPKENEVQVKNAHKADASKSDLTVPERKFVEKATSDNLADIELGRLALEKSQSPEVKNYAQMLVDDHKKSLDKLKTIANDQKFPVPTSATTRAQADYDRLAKLDGADFDREFKKLMDKRHDEALQTFQKASNEVQNPDLKSYINQTLPMMKEHKEKLAK
jgi:putative membrane protein